MWDKCTIKHQFEFSAYFLSVQCPVQKVFNWWSHGCYDSYSQEKESRDSFYRKQFKHCPYPWVYQTAEELGSSPTWGHHAWYGGGGYSAGLGYDVHTARAVIKHLQSENWIDRQTRAVIVEFTVFNPTSSTLAVSSFFFELLQTGQATVFKHIDTITLYNTETIVQVFQGICLILFIAMVFYKIVAAIAVPVRQGRRCICSPWYWLDIAHLISSVSVCVFSFIKSYHTAKSVQDLRHNIFAMVNFQTAVVWTDVENAILAILTFLTTVKLMQLTYFNMYTRVFAHALRIWMADFFSFLFVLSIIFLAFLLTGFLLFGSHVVRYSSVWASFSFQLEIVLGKVKARPIKQLIEASPGIGQVFISLLLLAITVILMNLFISTLNNAVNAAKALQLKKEEKNTENSQANPSSPNRRSKEFFDQISNHLKTIDVIQNLPQMYLLNRKLTEVLKRIDEARTDEEHGRQTGMLTNE